MPKTAKPSGGKHKRKRVQVRTKRPARPAAVAPVASEFEHGALDAFFAQYQVQGFAYNSTELPPLEFRRLQSHLGIHRNDPESRPLWEAFGQAMTAEFGIKFGKNVNDLAAWQKLCKRIGINPVPTSLKEARTFKETHVNIVGLMTTRIGDGEMKKFDTEEELAEYTRSERPGLTFPREFVEKGGILWYLVRRIWHPLPEGKAQ